LEFGLEKTKFDRSNMDTEVVKTLFLFEGLSEAQRALLMPMFIPCDFEGGTILFEQGDPAENLYVVITGEVLITYKPDDAPVITVARVQPGSIVGWSAAIGSRFYTSAAVCTIHSQLLRVRGDNLRKLCTNHPETGGLILDRLATVIAERLHSTHDLVMSLLKMGMHNAVDQPGG
jgi:toluene monooxygenase system ferredoxin subunit